MGPACPVNALGATGDCEARLGEGAPPSFCPAPGGCLQALGPAPLRVCLLLFSVYTLLRHCRDSKQHLYVGWCLRVDLSADCR